MNTAYYLLNSISVMLIRDGIDAGQPISLKGHDLVKLLGVSPSEAQSIVGEARRHGFLTIGHGGDFTITPRGQEYMAFRRENDNR